MTDFHLLHAGELYMRVYLFWNSGKLRNVNIAKQEAHYELRFLHVMLLLLIQVRSVDIPVSVHASNYLIRKKGTIDIQVSLLT
jgi:hypothetical protein